MSVCGSIGEEDRVVEVEELAPRTHREAAVRRAASHRNIAERHVSAFRPCAVLIVAALIRTGDLQAQILKRGVHRIASGLIDQGIGVAQNLRLVFRREEDWQTSGALRSAFRIDLPLGDDGRQRADTARLQDFDALRAGRAHIEIGGDGVDRAKSVRPINRSADAAGPAHRGADCQHHGSVVVEDGRCADGVRRGGTESERGRSATRIDLRREPLVCR